MADCARMVGDDKDVGTIVAKYDDNKDAARVWWSIERHCSYRRVSCVSDASIIRSATLSRFVTQENKAINSRDRNLNQ